MKVIHSGSKTLANDLTISVGMVGVVCFFIISGIITYSNISELRRNSSQVLQTHESIIGLETLLSLIKDAETGQRGYLITGDEKYLEPFNAARNRLQQQLERVQDTLRADSRLYSRFTGVQANVKEKMDITEQLIALRRKEGFAASRDLVATDIGKKAMEELRADIRDMEAHETDFRLELLREHENLLRNTIFTLITITALGVFLSCLLGALMRRANAVRRQEQWIQNAQTRLSEVMLAGHSLDKLGDSVLAFLAEYAGAQVGAIYIEENGLYRRHATYGVPAEGAIPHFVAGEGLMGQAVKDRRRFVVDDVPESYINLGSSLGKARPRHLLIAPAKAEGRVNAVLELGFLKPVNEEVMELVERVAESVGTGINAAQYRSHLQNLLEETQRQAEELQAQGEELRVSNEELEEQSRALQESQVRMEQQQAELEQTNAQLEEQTVLLEAQRDDLARAQTDLRARSREVEQASRYKSEFLANMSHELRTPLNSSLILAKLLSDNPEGNLTGEQVRYAETIQSSGNDLLSLINDILDLSKIEAGHMEIRAEPVRVSETARDLLRLFEAQARQKGIGYSVNVESSAPAVLTTDGKRLEQILKNLLSNAVKFTDSGEVSLTVFHSPDGRTAFAVQDTGVGIEPEKHEVIFEAFRQADGTTNRKYGGTGLGLSISRELARLLGGEITLASEPGKGSVFTLLLPEKPESAAAAVSAEADSPAAPLTMDATPVSAPALVEDDRENLTPGVRTLLVVEDDEAFARILSDLAHEQRFQCLVTSTADEAVRLAVRHLPSAVILDVGLPDHSGLSVLDRLKQDARTRHIPVHVISANDYAETAFSLGAAGYALKPVKREELLDVMKKMERAISHRVRRVLIVEDDEVQRESVQKLLSSQDVEIIGVGTAQECLGQLKEHTFDCMVLDLSLPDASGYALLETLGKEEAYSFPPVIVYTGRDLTAEDEQRLRRYSRSIIIKGAKSPERLLDEVTLFLHQVVSELPPEQQRMLKKARNRDAALEGRRILVVEDDIRNVYALTSIFEPRGATVQIARNGKEGLAMLSASKSDPDKTIDLVLMDVMMPEMDGLTATREIRRQPEWKKLPVIMLTAKAMKDDQERCLAAGASDYMAKPLDVEKLLSLVRVWLPR